jgi:hypothetical protein
MRETLADITKTDRKGTIMKQIRVCIYGDYRHRDYNVTYLGIADFPRWEREDGNTCCGVLPVALIDNQGKEHLVAEHPDYGWVSVGREFCRDFEPALDAARLGSAT